MTCWVVVVAAVVAVAAVKLLAGRFLRLRTLDSGGGSGIYGGTMENG